MNFELETSAQTDFMREKSDALLVFLTNAFIQQGDALFYAGGKSPEVW